MAIRTPPAVRPGARPQAGHRKGTRRTTKLNGWAASFEKLGAKPCVIAVPSPTWNSASVELELLYNQGGLGHLAYVGMAVVANELTSARMAHRRCRTPLFRRVCLGFGRARFGVTAPDRIGRSTPRGGHFQESGPIRYRHEMRILVLGAGFGGLELSTRLSDELGDGHDVVLIDRSDGFIFGFSKLDVMFGRSLPESVFHLYDALDKPGPRSTRSTYPQRSIQWLQKRRDGRGDLRKAMSWSWPSVPIPRPSATPGLVDGGHRVLYGSGGARLREVLARLEGGDVIVGVTSTPFKCPPPAPSETALLMHDFLDRQRGIREKSSIALVMPLGVPIPPSPAASRRRCSPPLPNVGSTGIPNG